MNNAAAKPSRIEQCYPLDEFYSQHNLVLPPIEFLEGDQVPEPYRSLLVHSQDMTSTLERFHGETIHLEVLKHFQHSESYFREVVLILDQSQKIVEFGAIRIFLDRFEPLPRNLILEGRLPLGRIIQDFNVPFISQPSAFLRVGSDRWIQEILKLSQTETLYGRQNRLLNAEGQPLAEIVEILPPTNHTKESAQ
jgi:chorismate-pyruvate lyase